MAQRISTGCAVHVVVCTYALRRDRDTQPMIRKSHCYRLPHTPDFLETGLQITVHFIRSVALSKQRPLAVSPSLRRGTTLHAREPETECKLPHEIPAHGPQRIDLAPDLISDLTLPWCGAAARAEREAEEGEGNPAFGNGKRRPGSMHPHDPGPIQSRRATRSRLQVQAHLGRLVPTSTTR